MVGQNTRRAGLALWLATAPAWALDVHLQALPPAPGLNPSRSLGALDGMKEALNCGLAFLDTAQQCGLSGADAALSPFAVTFDPMFCRLTMRFSVGGLIDGLLKDWLAGAYARLGSPSVGALCVLGIGPQYCGAQNNASSMMSPVLPPRRFQKPLAPVGASASQQQAVQAALEAATRPTPDAPRPTPAPSESENPNHATGLDSLIR